MGRARQLARPIFQKKEMKDFKVVQNCRVCGSDRLREYLDLGKAPLANSLLPSLDYECGKYPLEVLFCEVCSLSQLSIVINPEIMYRNYPYHSSVSETFKKHCSEMAVKLKPLMNEEDPLVVDIASNDGCLLEHFRLAGYEVLGVEPAANLVEISRGKGIEIVHDFWSEESSNLASGANLIAATNVFAHVDDVWSFLGGVKKALVSDGIFVMEIPYLYNILSKNQFDTIYHEHLSYFLLKPLKILFESCGMRIFKVEQYDIHGGSIRVYASKDNRHPDESVAKMLEFEEEHGLYDYSTYKALSGRVIKTKEALLSLLNDLKAQDKKVMAYGAAAKGISLLNACGIDATQIQSIADDTPDKQGKFAPGCGIPIVDSSNFLESKPDYIVLLPWNFAEELIRKTKDYDLNGVKYIMPIPQPMVLT